MNWPVTIALTVLAAALLGVSAWQSGRPRKDSLNARWIPWKFLILLFAAAIIYLGVHMANLAGFHTGTGRPY